MDEEVKKFNDFLFLKSANSYIDELIIQAQKAKSFLLNNRDNLTYSEKTLFYDAIDKCTKSLIFIQKERIQDYYKCIRCLDVDTQHHDEICEKCKEFYEHSSCEKEKVYKLKIGE